jgi:myo-inositol-1(or 4)-monophosphatase
MKPTLDLLTTWAAEAGEIIRAGYGKAHDISYKGRIDLVTETDHTSEDLIIGHIRQDFPDHSIITEESGKLAGLSSQRWFIDPLDGTVNYSHGMPFFGVSIAYAENGQVQLGVIYNPIHNECFSAERGKGAWLNGAPIHVKDPPDLLHSLLVTGFPYDMWENPDNNLDNFVALSRLSQGVRRMGSAALDLCYVAAGWLDGYWEIRIKPWDIAAGALIVEEAGGKVTKLNGDANYMQPPYDILACTPRLYGLIREVLNKGK